MLLINYSFIKEVLHSIRTCLVESGRSNIGTARVLDGCFIQPQGCTLVGKHVAKAVGCGHDGLANVCGLNPNKGAEARPRARATSGGLHEEDCSVCVGGKSNIISRQYGNAHAKYILLK